MKIKPIRSNVLRKFAQGQHCQVNVRNACNYDPETVVMAHISTEGGKMGGKESDISACHACSDCHDLMDGRTHSKEFAENKEFYISRALVRTINLLQSVGLITVKGSK